MVAVGCGVCEITPPVGTPLSGFIFRENQPSTGIDDHLYVRVLAFRTDQQVYWLINYELLGISADLETRLHTELAAGLGEDFSPTRCVIVAVHNHSGPTSMPLRGEAQPDPAYISHLCQATVEAARDARHKLRPASLHQAWLNVPELTYNRRAILADGRVSMAFHPEQRVMSRGPVDRRLSLLVWKDAGGRNLAAAVHFACHGVAVCAQTIGSDIPGAIARHFEARLDAPCLYLQGAAGDLNPLVVSAARAEMLPWVTLFEETVRGFPAQLQPVRNDLFALVTEWLPLDYAPLPPRKQVLRRLKQFERIASGDVEAPEVVEAVQLLGDLMNVPPGEKPEPHKAAFCAQALLASEQDILGVIDRQGQPNPCPLKLAVWRLGGVALAFSAAELFAQTGLQIRALRKDLDILPVTYAAPVVGYIPDAAAMQAGGYEVDFAWHFYGSPAPFVPQSEGRILEKLGQMLQATSR